MPVLARGKGSLSVSNSSFFICKLPLFPIIKVLMNHFIPNVPQYLADSRSHGALTASYAQKGLKKLNEKERTFCKPKKKNCFPLFVCFHYDLLYITFS